MGKFPLYSIALILLLIIAWMAIPYVIGVAIILIVATQVINLTRKSKWNI